MRVNAVVKLAETKIQHGATRIFRMNADLCKRSRKIFVTRIGKIWRFFIFFKDFTLAKSNEALPRSMKEII